MNIETLIRPNILALSPYVSARSEFEGKVDVSLDANENPFENGYNRYPDPLAKKVKKVLAEIKNVTVENIFFGNGSDEVIDILVRIFCEPKKDKIIYCPPTFGMFKVVANLNDVGALEIPLTADFQLQKEKIIAEKDAKLLFICSPNNPTGNQFLKEEIIYLLENFNGIVVVDEAYADFSNYSMLPFINQYSNLLVLQTFSKAWGMAGVRLGVGYANSLFVSYMNKVKMPYNINTFTQKIALEALNNLPNFEIELNTILTEREKLITALAQQKCVLKIFPSDANFLLVRFQNANEMYQKLLTKGIVVRSRTKDLYCENCLRITIGIPEENLKLIQVLSDL